MPKYSPDPTPDQSGKHYKEFNQIYDKVDTTEKYHPSLGNTPKASLPYLSLLQLKMQKIQVQLFSAKNVISGGLFTLSMF